MQSNLVLIELRSENVFTFFTNFLTGLIVLFIAYFEVSSLRY